MAKELDILYRSVRRTVKVKTREDSTTADGLKCLQIKMVGGEMMILQGMQLSSDEKFFRCGDYVQIPKQLVLRQCTKKHSGS